MPLLNHINTVIARCRAAIGTVFDLYRPELHYMRGPGPRWRAKQMRLTP
jgi:hypothetical protein